MAAAAPLYAGRGHGRTGYGRRHRSPADPVRGLANPKRSTAPSNGMDAKSSVAVPLSSPAAAQRCAEGAGLDSGAPAAAQSAMPSIALPATAPTADHFPPTPLHPRRLSFTRRISTSLTDVTAVDLLDAKALTGEHG